MWTSRTKDDLIIEVWEKLDCESVGRAELEAIEAAVEGVFGPNAVDPPMVLARRLADEGAHLRYPEIMELYLDRAGETAFDVALRNACDFTSASAAMRSIERLDNLRKKLVAENDKASLNELKQTVIELRREMQERALNSRADERTKLFASEIDEWLSHWLRTPEIFFAWADLRQNSADFKEKFGSIEV
ncbi:MAG: hypothetical protein UZ17_ACD001000451 [Acidobacteria bacterium OLB17]|nr:MAG: hypothetical protein UZ17_ACD001000451 [Acidobacteria bacterium OLB17]MCZ2391141.1 hypothetical protein [Acidobacteriota bacterium]